MPFNKIAAKLQKLYTPEKLTAQRRQVIERLKKKECTPAEAAFELYPEVGSKSHATFAIIHLILLQQPETNADEILRSQRQYIGMIFEAAIKGAGEFSDQPEVTTGDVNRALSLLVEEGRVTRSPSGRITLPKK